MAKKQRPTPEQIIGKLRDAEGQSSTSRRVLGPDRVLQRRACQVLGQANSTQRRAPGRGWWRWPVSTAGTATAGAATAEIETDDERGQIPSQAPQRPRRASASRAHWRPGDSPHAMFDDADR